MLDKFCPDNLQDNNDEYWKNKFQQITPLYLPADKSSIGHQVKINGRIRLPIDVVTLAGLRKLSGRNEADSFLGMVTAFHILLFRYTNQADFCAVVTNDDREIPVCITNISGDDTVADLMNELKGILADQNSYAWNLADEHPEFLKYHFVVANSTALIAMNNANEFFPHAEMVFVAEANDEEVHINLLYDDELYTKQSINTIGHHYINLLKELAVQPEAKIGALQMLSPTEYEALNQFNDTLQPYPSTETLNGIFEQQVLRTPLNTALCFGEHTMTYTGLNEAANRLANYLISRGTKPGDNIGLVTKRSFDMIVGMYGILKAGGAYVPVDPDYPIDRQEYILENSAVTLVLTDAVYPVNTSFSAVPFIVLAEEDLQPYETTNPGLLIDARQLAYTIYTSGSTGRPKGVMIEHHSAINLLSWVNNRFNVGEEDRMLFITSMCFDLSVYDVFGILAAGGTVVIADQYQVNDITRLLQMLQRYQITFWDSVPTTLDYLVKELENVNKEYRQTHLRLAFLSGDWIPVDLPSRLQSFFPAVKTISLGGATEGTVWSNYFPVEQASPDWKSIPYGKPIANNFFYILNEQLQPAPIGVTGELYIGGVGVARGYANDPEKTAASFVEDPFNQEAGGRMYRTGDLGRMLPGMNMEFIGRKDTQVKINGFRVELGEIESILNQCPLVSGAVVLAKDDKDGKKRLFCYVIPNGAYKQEAIINYIKHKLPEYMVPALWMELKNFPLNSNGKIDRKALPEIEVAGHLSKYYTAPVTDDEISLTNIWQQVMKQDRIGIHDNFFELGGHSLMAMQIISRMEKQTGKKLPLAIFFKHPTVASLLAAVERDNISAGWKCLVPIKATGKKMPLYIIHGEGLHVLNFSELSRYVDQEQPLYGLQASGLDGMNKPLNTMAEIAGHYISEILSHNPAGPYALAGYSFGGFLAVEMEKQLTAMGKEVRLLAIFDTNAENALYNKAWYIKLPIRLKQQLPKLAWIMRSAIREPGTTIRYQFNYFKKQLMKIAGKLRLVKQEEAGEDLYVQINEISQQHVEAFKSYHMVPFNNFVYLFRAARRLYFVNDFKYLGWRKYARKGVKVFEVPGDHITMLQQPNVPQFGAILQEALNNC
jgi:amino acid adenylation domain-containing protein